MFLKKDKRVKENYSLEVQNYLQENAPIMAQKLYEGVIITNKLNEQEVEQILGTNYPKAPWIHENDVIGQFICLLHEAGYVFSYNKKGKIEFKNEELYGTIVKNHLRLSGSKILKNMARYCATTKGRITYEEMQEILGFHYPKAPYVCNHDMRVCTILFLKETGLPFKFDQTHIYLP